ncbi:MAG: hypothetical protein ACKOZM_05155 [Flavobacteriales bacterium]
MGCLLVAFSSCKRTEPTSWDADVKGPLAYGRLSLANILSDTLLTADENGLWHVMLDENLTDFDLDSIVQIPDTTITKQYPLFVTGDFPQGFALPISPTQEIRLQLPVVQLKEVHIKSGQLKYRVHSPVDGYLNCSFNIPGLTSNGVPQSLQVQTQPPVGNEEFIAEGLLDLSGFELDLTGESGTSFNRIEASFTVVVDANAPQPAHVAAGDVIELELLFVDPKVSYARGYFGTHEYALDEEIDFSAVANMPQGLLDLDGTSMQFSIRNAVGVDAQIDFNEISNWNETTQTGVALDYAPLFAPINITRAQDQGGSVQAYEYSYNLNSSNSNLDAFLENLPSRFKLQGDVRINPLGNVSDANDFIYTDDALQARMKMDIPLRLGMQNLHISDTLHLTNSAQDIPLDGNLMLWMQNGFPLEASVSLFIIENGQRVVLAEQLIIPAATPTAVVSSPTPSQTWLEIPVTPELLAKVNAANPLLLDVMLQTPGAPNPVGLYANQFIDFK